MLDFSDRTRTGISKLISRCAQSCHCLLQSWDLFYQTFDPSSAQFRDFIADFKERAGHWPRYTEHKEPKSFTAVSIEQKYYSPMQDRLRWDTWIKKRYVVLDILSVELTVEAETDIAKVRVTLTLPAFRSQLVISINEQLHHDQGDRSLQSVRRKKSCHTIEIPSQPGDKVTVELYAETFNQNLRRVIILSSQRNMV